MQGGSLGTGLVAQALARGFRGTGHDVRIGTRDPGGDKARSLGAVTFADAARFGELAVLATLWSGPKDVNRLAGPDNFAGKVVIDTTNPLDSSHAPPPRLAVGFDDSAGEQVQRWLPQARVVKAFTIVGNAFMVQPQFPGGPPDMFICGNDAAAKQTVTDICRSFGWPGALDLGGIEMARYLEPLAMVWIVYGFGTGSWNHAFKLLRK